MDSDSSAIRKTENVQCRRAKMQGHVARLIGVQNKNVGVGHLGTAQGKDIAF